MLNDPGWSAAGQGRGGRVGGAHQPLPDTGVHPIGERPRFHLSLAAALVQGQCHDDGHHRTGSFVAEQICQVIQWEIEQ